jgi:hypothetical protein
VGKNKEIGIVFVDNYLDELVEFRKKYPELNQERSNGSLILSGRVRFDLVDPDTGKPPIKDEYNIEITIPSDFPITIPSVRELDGKINRSYEHISQKGVLCLGIPTELRLILKKYPTVEGFIDNIIKPNLFAYSFYRKYRVMPWGERPAGPNAFFLYYAELFQTLNIETLISLIQIVIKGDYRGNSYCPCGGSKTLNECHGESVYNLWQMPWNCILNDYLALLDFKLQIDTASLFYRKYGIL